MNSKTIGERSEAMVAAALMKAGKVILTPFGDNQRYDLVIDENGVFQRVQCKTGRISNGRVRFQCCSITTNKYVRKGAKPERKTYRGQIELFGVYCPDNDKVYLVPIEAAPSNDMYLRLEKPKNGQAKGINMAEDYELK